MNEIKKLLEENIDEKYRDFQRKLIVNIRPEGILGVRTPILRKIAKEVKVSGEYKKFLNALPHDCFEENQIHGFIIEQIKDFDECIAEMEKFLPYIDNWATCDQTSPKIFKNNKKYLLKHIEEWIKSTHTYTVRYGIGMLMQHYLDEDFEIKYMDMVAGIQSQEYYVKMEIAWYMATALAKQWDVAITYIENRKLDVWVHNKTIQKARESYRITDEKKRYLKQLKY